MEYERWKKKKNNALKDGDLPQLIVCCKQLADHHVINDNYTAALDEYKEMERAAEAVQSELDVARANRMIGEMYCELGNFDSAIFHQRRHLDIAKKQNDDVELQRALATLGRTYFMMSGMYREGNIFGKVTALKEAKQYFTKSLAVCEQLSDSMIGSKQRMEMRARLFLNLGLVHDEEGQTDSAIDYINQAVMICKKEDLWEDLFKAYIALGCTYNKYEMKKEAILTFDKCISVAERLSSKVASLCEALSNKAEALLGLPDFRGARQTLLRAYHLRSPSTAMRNEIEQKLRIVAAMCEAEDKLTELGPDAAQEERKKLYENIGDMASELKSFQLAGTYYTLMLQCVENCGGDSKALIECYVSLAETYKDNRDYRRAVDYFKKEVALEKDSYEESGRTYLNIAEMYHLMGKNVNSIEAYTAAKNCAEAANNPKLLNLVLTNMVIHFKEIGEEESAESVAIRQELENLKYDGSFSSDEEENDKPVVEFGAHINLETISDPDADSETADGLKATRTRTKVKSLIHKKNELGETPLHRAAIAGNLALAIKLIEQGHALDVRDYCGWTPLHEAANHGHIEIVELLLKKGAAVNDRGGAQCNGVTPLLDAALCGHFEIMDLLLQYKASPLMKNNDGMSILDLMSDWKVTLESQDGCKLNPQIQEQFDAMYSKLQQILERAGHKPSQKPQTPVKPQLPTRRTTSRVMMYDDDDHINVKMPVKWDDDSDSCLPKPLSRLYKKSKATSEYESAMRSIRFRNKDIGSSSLAQEPKQPALIPENNIVGEDWLEEDIIRPNKKRKPNNTFLNETRRNSKTEENLAISSVPKELRETHSDSSNDGFDWTTAVEQTDALARTSPSSEINHPSTSGACSNKLKMMNLSRRNEMNLSSPDSTKEKVGKLDSEIPADIPAQSSSSLICVRVLVEGKLLLVPVPPNNEHLNIEWLAEETAYRYKCLEEVEPRLRLLTPDGAILLNSDPVSLVLSLKEVQGQVLSWNLPSLVSSYEDLCFKINLVQDTSLTLKLEACPATNSVDFSDIYLDFNHLSCALRVLSHHQPLQCLNLSGNFISDSNMKEIAENLVKLPNLRCLNLSNINISSEGLSILTQVVIDHNGLKRLQTLDLGFNPLGDCLKALGDLINILPGLTAMSIPAVDLVTESFHGHLNFTLDTLESLNVSYNDIGTQGIVDFLGLLNPRSIQELHFSHTGGKTIREVGIFLQVNAPPSLRSLDLSYCDASKEDVSEFIQGLEMCPHLEVLSLEGVCGLEQENMNDLMSCKSVRNLQLGGSLNVQQPLQVTDHLATLTISTCVEQEWGRKGPFGFNSTNAVQHPMKQPFN